MPVHTPSPVDLPERDDVGSGLGWTFATIIVAALVLLVANAVSLRDWVDDRPPGPIQAKAAELADQWLALTEATGIAAPRDALHAQWKRAEEARFPAIAVKSEGAANGPGPHR